MSVNHDFEAVGKEVIFTQELENPLKLFTVIGDVFVKIVPVFNGNLSVSTATIKASTQDGSVVLLTMDGNKDDYRLDFNRILPDYPISSDIYQTISIPIASGTITYYCVFAKLSADGSVEAA